MNQFTRALATAREIKGIVYYNNSFGNFFPTHKPILNPHLELIADFSTT